MYEELITKLDTEIKKSRCKRTQVKDVESKVNSILSLQSDTDYIPSLKDSVRVKRNVVIGKVDNSKIPTLQKKKKEVVWL